MRGHQALITIAILAAPAVGQGVTLEQLADMARKRFEVQQAQQGELLGPFLKDLELDYARNREYLERRFDEAAALGETLVPGMLERLVPREEGERSSVVLAENAARVLARIGPSGFVDDLLKIARGSTSYTARLLAIRLLGQSGSRSAGEGLAALLPRLRTQPLATAIDGLTRLRYADVGPRIAEHLTSDRTEVREAALRYLAALRPAGALESVLAQLRTSPDRRQVKLYLDYLRAAATANAEAATTLLELLADPSLDTFQRTDVCRTLQTVAPNGHRPTIDACRALLEQTEGGELATACALTMHALGDSKGVSTRLNQLKQRMARERRDAEPFIERADLLLALERWTDAARDYEEAIKRTRNFQLTSYLNLQLARCEAHRKRWSFVVRALRESGKNHAAILQVAREDPVFAEALQQSQVRSYLEELQGR